MAKVPNRLVAICAAAFGLSLAAATGASAATLIDFTDRPIWQGSGVGATSFHDYGDFTVTLFPNRARSLNFNQNFDGGSVSYCGGSPLACDSDGLGLVDDEITTFSTTPKEYVEVVFSEAVKITDLYFLDLFKAKYTADLERAKVEVNGAGAPYSFDAVSVFQQNGGFLHSIVSFDNVTKLKFWAGTSNDGKGYPDFALGGITVSPVPIPAALPLFASGLGLMGWFARRKKRMAAAEASAVA